MPGTDNLKGSAGIWQTKYIRGHDQRSVHVSNLDVEERRLSEKRMKESFNVGLEVEMLIYHACLRRVG